MTRHRCFVALAVTFALGSFAVGRAGADPMLLSGSGLSIDVSAQRTDTHNNPLATAFSNSASQQHTQPTVLLNYSSPTGQGPDVVSGAALGLAVATPGPAALSHLSASLYVQSTLSSVSGGSYTGTSSANYTAHISLDRPTMVDLTYSLIGHSSPSTGGASGIYLMARFGSQGNALLNATEGSTGSIHTLLAAGTYTLDLSAYLGNAVNLASQGPPPLTTSSLDGTINVDLQLNPTPEPSSLTLLGVGLVLLAWWKKRAGQTAPVT